MATPKRNRKTNVVSMTPPVHQNRSQSFEGHKPVPGPKEQYVPQSVTRSHRVLQPSGGRLPVSQSIVQSTRQPLQPSVQGTPSRVRPKEGIQSGTGTESAAGSAASLPVSPSYKYQGSKVFHLEFKDLDNSWPNGLKRSPMEATIKNQGIPLMGFGSDVCAAAEACVQGTPLKSVESNARARTDVGFRETPIKGTKKAEVGEAPSANRGASIYETLGWNEVDDLV